MIVTHDAMRHKMLHLLFTRDTISNELADGESNKTVVTIEWDDTLRIHAEEVGILSL